ncbi:MAG: radical SAM protein, partial [Pseudomonadota bacterium]
FNIAVQAGDITTRTCVESSPKNDRLQYVNREEVRDYLDQIDERKWPIREIAYTGGEPFMNPHMIGLARDPLARGFDVLILTNAMKPMMRPIMQEGLRCLRDDFGDKLTLRISIDHWSEDLHDTERGKGSFQIMLKGMRWLRDEGFNMAVAGRSIWSENDADARKGYQALFDENGFEIDAFNPGVTVLFPEMDQSVEVPEITTKCWGILDKSPDEVMCSSSRMVVKRKGAEKPTVLACTLLPYDEEFEMGETLEEAEKPVSLNHPHCAKFCVLGGASCSA